MTLSDLQLIRASFSLVEAAPEPFMAAFRRRAVAIDPSLDSRLPRSDAASAVRLVSTIASVLEGFDAAGCLRATDQVFAQRHRWSGIQPRHYGPIGQALLDALSARIGAGFTDAARSAWASAFVTLAEALMARCYNPLGLVA